MDSSLGTIYDDQFFDLNAESALRSAQVVVPAVVDLLRPESVVDIGCGRGAWVRVFQENGVERVQGIDGDYVDRSKLLIDVQHFRSADLRYPLEVSDTFDLAISLEVAEHLPEESGKHLVAALVSAAPVVLFSAAVPGQTGAKHINEQWPSYWSKLFANHGFVQLDVIRPRIWFDQRVDWWYRQNTFLYVSEKALNRIKPLQSEPARGGNSAFEWVHISLLQHQAERYERLSSILRRLPLAGWRSAHRSLGSGARKIRDLF